MSNNIPLVSVVTPSFNKGPYIEETILSITTQGYPEIEYIIIDGASTDETPAILKRYSEGIRTVSEPDNGQTDAINKGLRIAQGDILAYLNADDLYFPDTVERVVQYFGEHPEVDLVYGDIIHIDEDGGNEYIIRTGPLDIDAYLGCMYYLPQPTVFFRRKVYDTLGDFDASLHLAMDLDYWLRAYFRFTWGYIPEPLAKARIYGEAKSVALNYRYLEERLIVLEKISQYLTPGRKSRAVACIHYYGGLEYLRIGKINEAFHHMVTAIRRDPMVVITPGLYFAFFNSFFGRRAGDAIKKGIYRVLGSDRR